MEEVVVSPRLSCLVIMTRGLETVLVQVGEGGLHARVRRVAKNPT